MGLVDEALGGNIRSLSRLATNIENDSALAQVALERLYPLSGRAHTVGVTGPPGAGKSSLVNEMVAAWRAVGKTVAVIAIDPSSPLSGGATLGDRIRMLQHQGDPGVFIRSAATRGRTGGLAPTTAGLMHLFDAAGYDIVLVETVGTGQEEIAIVHYVESVVLVQVPGFGDGVQALKAGVLEIADIYAVNKSDLPDAQATAREIRALLTLSPAGRDWAPPVVAVSARNDSGIDTLVSELERHRIWLIETGNLATRRRSVAEKEIARQLQKLLDLRLASEKRAVATDVLIDRVANRQCTPQTAATRILANWSLEH